MQKSDDFSPPEKKIEIQLDPEIMQGHYSNVANISHTKEEFVLDYLFIQQRPAPFGKIVSRIILSPAHAKRLMNALADNIHKYEEKFGIIDFAEDAPLEDHIQ